MADGGDLGYYALPVLISFEGVDKQVNDGVGKSLGRLGDLGKKSGISLGKGIGDGLKTTQAEVNQATAAYEKLRDKAADALDKITVEEKKLAKARAGGKEDVIATAEARLAKARRDSTRASKEAEASHSSLLDKQKLLGAASGDLGGKLSALAGITSRLGPGVAALGVAAAGAAAGGIALLGAGAVTATRQLYELGSQWDDISDTLRVKTGATGGALDALTESVENIGRTVPLAYGQIGDVAAEVARNLHLTGPALEEVTGAVANLGRLTGEQVNVRDLGQAFRGFGVDAKDQVPVLDSLYQASQKTGLSVNEMVSTIAAKGSVLRQFGLSFGESASLVAQFTSKGVDADKTITTLNKAFAVFASKGIPARQGLQDVVQRIQQLIASGDEAGAADLTTKVFGTKGGVNFFELIKSGAVDLAALSSSVDVTGETIAQAAEGTADWSERWQLLKNEASDALKPLGDTVFNFVNEKLASLADWVSTHHDEIIDAFVTIGEFAISAGQDVLKSTGQMVEAFGQLVGGIGNVVGAFYKMRAWSVVGDDKQKAELNAQADAAFGWGESLESAGQKMVDFAGKGDDLKTELRKLADQSKDSTSKTELFGDAVKAAGGEASGAVGNVQSLYDAMDKKLSFGGGGFVGGFNEALSSMPLFGNAGSGTNGGFDWDKVAQAESSGNWANADTGNNGHYGGLQFSPETWKAFGGLEFADRPDKATREQQIEVANRTAFTGYNDVKPQGLGAWETITDGKVPGVTVDTKPTAPPQSSITQLAAGVGAGGGARVPYGLPVGTDTGGYGSSGAVFPVWVHALEDQFGVKASTYAGHQEGDGLNKGIDWSGPVDAMQRFAEYLATIPGALEQVIWDNPNTGQKIGVADGQFVGPGTSQPGYYAKDWADHQNHVHTRQSLSIPLPGGGSIDSTYLGQTGGSPSVIDLSRNNVDSRLVNAFGADYKAGIGTPGFDEEGNPGYYRTDPRQLAQAQRRVDDSQQAIADADQRIVDAKQKRAELEEDILATAEDRAKADRDVATAERAANRAREDAAWAVEDSAETAKGKFTAAKKNDQKSKSKSGGGGLDDLGGIAGSFLKETFGLDGSLFPDISDLPAVKSLGAALGFAKGPLEQAAKGQLGIQQPGWSPGDPLPDIGPGADGGGGGGLPLGMIPGISSILPSDPTAPGSNIHGAGGGGQPGPVDQSTHLTINNPQGDEQSIAERTRRTILSTPRLGTYSAPAQVGGG